MSYTALAGVTTLLAVLLSSLPPNRYQAGDTLKERARAKGGRTSIDLHVDMPFASLADVVAGADVVVRARIQRSESSLTKDGHFVRTYFAFVPTRIFKDVIGIDAKRRTPQMTVPLTFFEPGGVVRVEGLQITQTSNASVDPSLQVGEDVLLCLDWDRDENAFRLQDGPFGLMRVRGETVAEANKETNRRLNGTSVSDLEAEIERLVKGV